MASEDEGRTAPSETATAGPAQRMSATDQRRRAAESDLRSPEELDERQERLRRTRRTGGPDLDGGEEPGAAEDTGPGDVPPTEPQEPPPDEG